MRGSRTHTGGDGGDTECVTRLFFPNLLPLDLADIGEAQHRVKTSNINDDHFCLIQGDIQSFVK